MHMIRICEEAIVQKRMIRRRWNIITYILKFYIIGVGLCQDQCLRKCWKGMLGKQVAGGLQVPNVASENDCKDLCANNGTCVGIDWGQWGSGCWFQMTPTNIYNSRSDVNHWDLVNCSDECLSYCWKPLKNNSGVFNGERRASTDENHCKLLCSQTTNCISVDWDMGDNSCWLANSIDTIYNGRSGIHHWDIVRNASTNCQNTTTPATTSTTTPPSTTTIPPTTTTTSTNWSLESSQPSTSAIDVTSNTTANTNPTVGTPADNESSNRTAIIAGVVGGVGGSLLIALLILAIVCFAKKRRRKRSYAGIPPSPSGKDPEKSINPPKTDLLTFVQLRNHFQQLSDTKDGFKEEFNGLPSGDPKLCAVGLLPANKNKNRFKNIWPYDATRIKLLTNEDDNASDYINANYIQGYDGAERSYIATQGPLNRTLDDFWRMIWDENINRIVMITQVIEQGKQKCELYWPQQISESREFGKITVTLIECSEFSEFTKRLMKIEHEDGSESRLVTQLQCLIWGDKGVPSEAYNLLAFRAQVRLLDENATGPMLVHCSAGVGRTGTFVALDVLVEQAEKFKRLSVFEVAKKLRQQRMLMVQVVDQYRLLYSALLEWNNSGKTGISWSDFEESFGTATILENFPDSLKTRTEREFDLLQEVKSAVVEDEKSAGRLQQNKNKNRTTATIPGDKVRIYLSQGANQSDYINAALMTGHRWPNCYILAQLPLKNTANDFWHMVAERNCPTVVVLEPEHAIDEDIPWPREVGSNLQFDKLSVTLSSRVDIGSISAFELTLKQKVSSASQVVHLYQLCSWPMEEELPESSKDALDLIGLLSQRQQEVTKSAEKSTTDVTDKFPVVVVCLDGVKKCGLFSAASYMTDRMKNDREVDAYLSCRHLISCRPQAITSLAQYQYLYQLAAEYCQWSPSTTLEFPSHESDSKDIYVNVLVDKRPESVYANSSQ